MNNYTSANGSDLLPTAQAPGTNPLQQRPQTCVRRLPTRASAPGSTEPDADSRTHSDCRARHRQWGTRWAEQHTALIGDEERFW